jgi:hypothetical protein
MRTRERTINGKLSNVRRSRHPACLERLGRVCQRQEMFEHDRADCVRYFRVPHYFAELDFVHMRCGSRLAAIIVMRSFRKE